MDKNKISRFLNKALLYKKQNKSLFDFIDENKTDYEKLAFNLDEKISFFTLLIKIFSEKIQTAKSSLVNIDIDFIGENAAWKEIERRLKQSKKDKISNHILRLITVLVNIYEDL